ncbi:MAG: pyridoxamine 5'-phosphate oxidase [Bacteroidota bacterium]
MNRDTSGIRRDYDKDQLDESQLIANPTELFQKWLDEAIKSKNIEPTAMVLSTIETDSGSPTSRVVLLKGIVNGKFRFFTNYYSRKSKEIEQNSHVSLNFFWPELEKQVRIHGNCERMSSEASDEYFSSRPKDSQIGAWVSHQSSPLESREIIEDQFSAMTEKFEGQEIKRPDYWGGFEITPNYFEFWQGRVSRLHDRFEYRLKTNMSWDVQRLYP